MRRAVKEIEVNPALLNIITPMGLEIKRNSLVIGENTGRIYGIVKYPQQVDYGWLAKITNIPGTVVSITFVPIDSGEFISGLSSSIIQNRVASDTAKDPLSQQRAEKAVIDGEKIMLQVDQNGEVVGTIIISIMVMARDEELFNKICRKTVSTIAVNKCKGRIMAHLQEQAFKSISPYHTLDDSIEEVLKRVMPMSSYIGGFPFSSSGYNDGTGYYFARDNAGGLIILDPWKRGDDRTNSNFVIMGDSGVGKSTVVKHIALSEYMKGTKIIFIDPEREMRELCKSLDGDWINAGGGNKGKINPLQIRPTPVDDEEDSKEDGEKMGDMALYMKTLDIFFNLYLPDLSSKEKAILKASIIELYNNFGITWDTDITSLSNDDFPIFTDLYYLIDKKAKEKENNIKMNEINEYEDLALLLQDIAFGSDSFLWNGKSTIKTNTRCICLDTHDLQNTSENVKRTQYFNLLTWCWQQMSANRSEPVLLICDEAYLMIDPKVPESLVFLRNVEKRARKYEGGVAIISHSVVDFLDPDIKMYGQALLDIPCFKILMGCDGKNLMETKELFKLTDAEEELLEKKKRGHALLIIGSKRLHVNFEIPDHKFKYIGKAGGR
ncbi:ATP-binding protein [bacterium AH-315-G05]|nr:ATP-binding protein [bacterium AH-315-G05]